MTEPRTRLQAASLLGGTELPDPLRWSDLIKLLPQYKAALTAAARSGGLITEVTTIEPKPQHPAERGPWFSLDGQLRQAPQRPPQRVRYTTVRLGELRAFLERQHEPVPQWLLEVPAAPAPNEPHTAATLGALGGKATSERWADQRAVALRVAKQLQGVPDLLKKDYTSAMANELKAEGLEIPKEPTLRSWLTDWHEAGEIYLPPEASKAGRPRK